MQIFYKLALLLFSIAILLQIISPLAAEPLRLYMNVFFVILMVAAILAVLFYFLLSRKGKDRPI